MENTIADKLIIVDRNTFTLEEQSRAYISHINPNKSWTPVSPDRDYVVYFPRFSDDPSKMFDADGRYDTLGL